MASQGYSDPYVDPTVLFKRSVMIAYSHTGGYLMSVAAFRLSQYLLQSVPEPCRLASTPSI